MYSVCYPKAYTFKRELAGDTSKCHVAKNSCKQKKILKLILNINNILWRSDKINTHAFSAAA